MITECRAARALATGAAALALAACSAGITHANPPQAPATSASHHPTLPPARTAASSSSPSPSRTANTARVAGLGAFPLPSGAQVAASLACGKGDIIEAGPVKPAAAAAFYTSALPRAGYTITVNSLGADPTTGAPDGIATLMFTGHRYSGVIIAMADMSSAGSGTPSVPAMSGSLTHDVLEITLAPGNNPAGLPAC
jgi:hypothetical protein